MSPSPTLDRLTRQHFAHLPPGSAREALINLLDDLDVQTLREARVERHLPRTAAPPELAR